MRTLKIQIMFLSALVVLAGAARADDVPEPLPIGAPMPAFTLPGIDGKVYTEADFAGAKVLVLVFTCNHCPTAQAYEDRIQALAKANRERGVTLVAIMPNDPLALRLDELGYTDLGDTLADTQQRAKDKGFDFPYLYDGDTQAVSRQFGPVSTPHVFILDQARTLRFRGRIDDAEHPDRVQSADAQNAIDALLAGKPVPVETTKTFGCSVKWSEKRATVTEAAARWAAEPVSLSPADAAAIREVMKNDSGKLRLVNVWATWCGPCVAEFPELMTIHQMYRSRDFEVLTISADPADTAPKVLAFLEKNDAATTNLHFSGASNYDLVEAVDPSWQGALPYTVLIKPGGEVLARFPGAIDPLAVKKAIVGEFGARIPLIMRFGPAFTPGRRV